MGHKCKQRFSSVTFRVQNDSAGMHKLQANYKNRSVPFNCVSRSLRTLFITRETKVLNNETQVALQRGLSIFRLAEVHKLEKQTTGATRRQDGSESTGWGWWGGGGAWNETAVFRQIVCISGFLPPRANTHPRPEGFIRLK